MSTETEELLKEGLKRLMDKCEVHLAFYVDSLGKLKKMSHQERKELRAFLHILLNQLTILDMEEEETEYEKELARRERR